MLEYQGVKIRWLGHDTFEISNGKKIVIDPYKLSKEHRADILLITHEHFDHLSKEDIEKVRDENTVVVAPKQCEQDLKSMNFKEVMIVKPNDKVQVEGISIEAVPAYNTNKINPSTNKPFHPKEDGKVGYIVTINGVRIYHAGDTDAIEEMKSIDTDIALLPVSGTYVMTVEEAAEAVKMIKPKLAIPMHYGAIVGSIEDANKFKQLVSECEVKILEQET
ncbi:MAG: MBL fold metallo-hydrolase [Candidatus Nitrosothermus koennekii]|nr:MAG: MBL fold metallo-hydrolase [Candidatus Nitrosothermus koennekii]